MERALPFHHRHVLTRVYLRQSDIEVVFKNLLSLFFFFLNQALFGEF